MSFLGLLALSDWLTALSAPDIVFEFVAAVKCVTDDWVNSLRRLKSDTWRMQR